MVRVAYLVSRFPSVTETFIVREMDELERRGFSVDLYSLVRDRPDLVQAASADRVATLTAGSDLGPRELGAAQLRWLRRSPRRLVEVWCRALWGNRRSPKFLIRSIAAVPVACVFAERIAETNVDRVHAHWATHPALMAYVIWRLTDVPYSVTAHAHDIYVDQSMLSEKLSSAQFVATISDFNRRFLVDRIPEIANRCHLVRCGVPQESIVDGTAPVQTSKIARIACVAQFKPYKGQRHLLNALKVLIDAGIDVRCSFAGGGEDVEAVTALAESLGITDHVRFLGSINSEKVAELLAESDIFVSPSVSQSDGKADGIPVALMEAMAARVPVVASNVTGIPELVENKVTGMLVEPGDPKGLAMALRTLIESPGLGVQLAEAGAARIAEEFTIEAAGERMAELLSEFPLEADDGTLVVERV